MIKKYGARPSLNAQCYCGSGKKYKHCCQPCQLSEGGRLTYNKRYARHETPLDHTYSQYNYSSFIYEKAKPYRGKIKCRLVHTEGSSIIIPDFLLLNNGGWIQPLFFTAPSLVQSGGEVFCTMYMDIQHGETIKIKFSNKDIIRSFSDKAQLFHCNIYGPTDIETYNCGDYVTAGGQIYLKLYHHTNKQGYDGISSSNSLWSSKWNYRGSKECLNFSFVYFTHIPQMKYANDLITVAMSADGKIDYAIDSFNIPSTLPTNYRDIFTDSIYVAEVYRSTTSDREHVFKLLVPIDSIDIKHTYLHHQNHLYFYETCFPFIHRIKVTHGGIVSFDKDGRIGLDSPIVHPDYSIIGDAQLLNGLAAPFEEEQTDFIFKIEDCGGQSIPEFWFSHANTDLYSGKIIETMNMKDVVNNPTK